jgi:hypothetical protein
MALLPTKANRPCAVYPFGYMQFRMRKTEFIPFQAYFQQTE